MIPRREQRVHGAERFRARRRDREPVPFSLHVLKGVAELSACGADDSIAKPCFHILQHLRLDDEHDPVKTGLQGVIYGVFHQNFAAGAYPFHLLYPAITGAEARSHDNERSVHIFDPFTLHG